MNKYPWDAINRARHQNEYGAQLTSEDINPTRKKIYWGRALNGNPALLVEYTLEKWHPAELPSFKNIHLLDDCKTSTIIIELLSCDMSDIFLTVCLDIIATLQETPENADRNACILRLERWCSFLRPSRAKLSPEAQKGLIAELLFLQREALSIYSEEDALKGWVGPEAGPRDFAFGQTFIEVKSKRSSANPSIIISSEDQLNINPSERLFLYVAELNDAPNTDEEAFSITDTVKETREMLQSPLQQAVFDRKLADAGYFDEDDYTDTRWSEGISYYYAVIDDFPRIDSDSCKPGVSNVQYQIDLDYCKDYQIDRATMIEAME